ncbi:MAG: GNAT family N-acetyltransferase [Bacteroidetes bacterium]|nr:GNAT family N-acetyltransferase [Bacteroidota bacterium]
MIRYLHQNEIDRDKWDHCILHAFNGMIYGYSWYLDIVAPRWEGLVENDYERVFPLPGSRRLGIDYIFQPFFTQQLGLFSVSILNPEKVHEFLNAIPSRYKWIELNLNTLNKIDSDGFQVSPQVNHELDLIQPYDGISRNYHTNTRRNLKKAAESGLNIVKNIQPGDVIQLFRQNRGKDVTTLKDDDYKRLSRLIHTCLHKGIAEVYGVYNHVNELCAGAVFVTANKKAIFLFSGMNQEGRESRAMFLLIDHFIREHAQSHLVLDFDGSNDPDLARFYRGFGSNECHYLRVTADRLPPLASWMKNLKSRFYNE